MRTQFSKFAFTAALMLAMAFTFSCSGGDNDGGGDPNNGGTGGGGSCNISSYKNKKMPDGKTWMTENLNCKVAGSECYGKDESNCNTYGRLYTWEAAKKACSGGWHLPSNDEWNALVTSVGGEVTAGKYLKATSGWNSGGNGEDTYGFSALPGGSGYSGGSFDDVGYLGYWWSASEDFSYSADIRDMGCIVYVGYDGHGKGLLVSVRCVQD